MLEMRSHCECCDKDLPAGGAGAAICSFECTFCAECAAVRLGFRCPNCGGELVRRPSRESAALARHPGSVLRVPRPLKCP